ncbi:ATP-dependent DNA helicase [Ruminococcus sp. OA3]|uniref:ATP-dependent DNA helicase n=1 Tax=Ruminococcus sp. OA3 TaxID=2914164 RepID=UPI001F055102|nr:ATP-dependent DNA helicase [Ruminococcus sp. OA3]MCH1982404.1 ATP-dependent DNA helicase [Ruminococcus sp. OA3]
MKKEVVKISVRGLVEFILRSGDLDSRTGAAPDKEAMQLGSKIHRKIQKSMGAEYQAEVPLRFEKEYDTFLFVLEGRADGIVDKKGEVLIDEIKGTFRNLEDLKGPDPLHTAQAMCYAWMYMQNHPCDSITVQITYCNMEDEDIRYFHEKYTQAELKRWFGELLEDYYPWAEFCVSWKKCRNESMQGLEFPFSYREGQREIVSSVYRTILRKKELFIQAPTGVGKTMSAVFPAVRAMGEGHGDKIFYLTARTIARTVAEEAFGILKDHGLAFKVITLTAKEKLCACEEMECSPEHCERARGHFDRVNDAVYEILTGESAFDRETLLRHSEKWKVCPYEMSLDLAIWTDAVICDYNYVFDPRAHLRRFFSEGVKGEYLFLIDEAHNLVERGREMFSAVLCKEDFLSIRKKVAPYNKKLERYLGRSNRQLLELKRECESYQVLDGPGALGISLMNLQGELETFLEELAEGELRKDVLEFYFQVRTFLNICDLLDENYVTYAYHDGDGKFYLRLFCVNPAQNLQQCLSRGRCTVFFSATLLPITYYRKLLGSREGDDYAIYVDSPFPRKNRALLIGRDVSSRYRRRGYEEYSRISSYIHEIISGKKGNYMIFFPSYRMLSDVYEVYREQYADEEGGTTRYLVQYTSMNEAEREAFLEAFALDGEHTTVGFCVMGGIFAEGIDLSGERLIGAVLIGTGLPQIGIEREILMNYYDQAGENGFDYAYRFPGMNKVLQAAGRVIRTDQDRGVIALLDERFLTADYRKLFPREWLDYRGCSLTQVENLVREFWEGTS